MPWTNAHDFLDDRAGFFRIRVVEADPPGAWDIVLDLDGGYSDRDTAEEIAQSFRNDLRTLLTLEDIQARDL